MEGRLKDFFIHAQTLLMLFILCLSKTYNLILIKYVLWQLG